MKMMLAVSLFLAFISECCYMKETIKFYSFFRHLFFFSCRLKRNLNIRFNESFEPRWNKGEITKARIRDIKNIIC